MPLTPEEFNPENSLSFSRGNLKHFPFFVDKKSTEVFNLFNSLNIFNTNNISFDSDWIFVWF